MPHKLNSKLYFIQIKTIFYGLFCIRLMDRQKTVYIDCLARKGIANCRLYLISSEDPTRMENITTIWKSLLQFVDPNDSKVSDMFY